MNNAKDIISAFYQGHMAASQCWEMLRELRKPKPKNEPEITAPPSKTYETLNEAELKAIELIQPISFGASGGARRFAHQSKDMKEMTARQREYLRLLVFKYRRQIFGAKNADARAKAYIQRMVNNG
jgi:hypothetical protein